MIATNAARPRRPTSSSIACGSSALSIRRARGWNLGLPGGSGLSDIDALEDTEPGRHTHERGAAMRHERKGDAGDRHDPQDPPDVADEWKQYHRAHTSREQRAERVARSPTGHEDTPEE